MNDAEKITEAINYLTTIMSNRLIHSTENLTAAIEAITISLEHIDKTLGQIRDDIGTYVANKV